MNITKVAVLTTLAAIIKKYKGNWGTASQKKLLELLATYHGIPIKRRMLSYHLADLREARLITTIKRHKRSRNGQICLLSSATALTMKGCLLLFRLGNRWALKQLRYLKHRYSPQPEIARKREIHHKVPAPTKKPPGPNPFLDPGARLALGLKVFPPVKV